MNFHQLFSNRTIIKYLAKIITAYEFSYNFLAIWDYHCNLHTCARALGRSLTSLRLHFSVLGVSYARNYCDSILCDKYAISVFFLFLEEGVESTRANSNLVKPQDFDSRAG